MFHQPALNSYMIDRFGPQHLVQQALINALFTYATRPNTLITDQQRIVAGRISTRLNSCCTAPIIVVDDDGDQIRITERRCKCRLCPLCGKARSRAVFLRILRLVATFDAPKFLTLTPRSNCKSLTDQIADIKRAFANLRRHPDWKHRVAGGLYTLEITYNSKRRQWHPHLHCIIDSCYFPQSTLAYMWSRVANGASIVDIRSCNSRTNIAKYIAGYVSKSSDISKFPEARRIQYAVETAGLRFVQTFGAAHKANPDNSDEYSDDGEHTTEQILSPDQLAYASTLGDKEAADLLTTVRKLERRRVSDAPPDQARDLEAGIREVVSRLRTWRNLHPEKPDCEPHKPSNDQARKRRIRDRTLRLWQEPGPTGYP